MSENKIITTNGLQEYFYESLLKINQQVSYPLPQKTIFYSSFVMEKYSLSQNFFSIEDGRVKNKILGISMLEANNLSKDGQEKAYRDVAEMTLMTCGYFRESVKRKIVDVSYYKHLGQTAYQNLDQLQGSYFGVPHFFKTISTSFELIVGLLSLYSKNHQKSLNSNHLFDLNEHYDESELLVLGVSDERTTKAS